MVFYKEILNLKCAKPQVEDGGIQSRVKKALSFIHRYDGGDPVAAIVRPTAVRLNKCTVCLGP